nr:hypothetical protein [Pseudanabaena sp. FACHB-2040]
MVRTKDLNASQIEAIVQQYRNVFLELQPNRGEMAVYKAIMLIFPDLEKEEEASLIDEIQQRLKPFFVEEGLMIGEFHEWNQTPGLHNAQFRPLQSPLPMLAIRFMVESDLPFLDRLTDDPQVRACYLKAYLNRLGAGLEEQKLRHAQTALMLAQSRIEPLSTQLRQPASKCPFARLAAAYRRLFTKGTAA